MRGFTAWSVGGLLGLMLAAGPVGAATTSCLTGTAPEVAADPGAIRTTRGVIDAYCPCAAYDGSPGFDRRAYKRCAKNVIDLLIDVGALRTECRSKVRRFSLKSICGYATPAVVCMHEELATGYPSCEIASPPSACRATAGVESAARCSAFTHCIDAADVDGDLRIAAPGDTGQCAPQPTARPKATPTPNPLATGADGKRLAELLNAYRVANGKPAHPLSRSMMATAATHVADLKAHPEIDSGVCTPHSWSSSGGLVWTGCCYTLDHAQADCMWRKPREITAGLGMIQYTGNGYEIALRGYEGNTPEDVLAAFTNSAPHRAVMLSSSGWEFLDAHPAMGAAMLGKYSVVWFGDATDPNR